MKTVFLYVTFSNKEDARRIAHLLIEQKLIACANILPEITSIYRWDNKIENQTETAAIFKTTSEKAKAASEKIHELHSYECPCVAHINIDDLNQPYLNWIQRSLT